MKLEIKLRKGEQATSHQVESSTDAAMARTDGQRHFVIDGRPLDADCARTAPGVFSILINGQSSEARVQQTSGPDGTASNEWLVNIGGDSFCLEAVDPRSHRYAAKAPTHDGPLEIVAPMPGKIVKILIAPEEEVAANQGLVVIEAMKMQNELRAPRPGRVAEIYVREGAGIETGAKLLRLE